MLDSLRLLFLSTLLANISFGAPADVKTAGDAAKEKNISQDEKGERGEYQPPPPVVTEHAVTLADGKVLNYKAIAGYLLIRDTKQENEPEKDSGKESAKESAQ